MQISRLESFALEKLLQPQSNHALVTAQPALRVLERVQTTAGIYSIIQLPASLQALQNSTELEWPFKLKRLLGRVGDDPVPGGGDQQGGVSARFVAGAVCLAAVLEGMRRCPATDVRDVQ